MRDERLRSRSSRRGIFLLEIMVALAIASMLWISYQQLCQQMTRSHEKILMHEEASSCAAWMARCILADPSVLHGSDPIRQVQRSQGKAAPHPRVMWGLEQVPLAGHLSEVTVMARTHHPAMGTTEARMVVIVRD